MKRAEITEGNCYRISRSVDSIPLLKKEINEGRFIMNKGRPYVVVFNSPNDDFIWVAPLTSNEQKYRSYIKLEEEKYHNAKSYIITSCGDKNSAITRHRHGVIKNCYKAGILWQGLRHDLSKYSPEEFLKGCKYYQGTRSPHEAEREEYGFSYGWMHHKGRNKHHFEYWTDYDLRTKLMTPVKMPLKYVKEMFCDRVAASKIYMKDKYDDGAPLAYFLRAKKTRAIHPETSDLLEKLLTMLRDKGEDYTFAYIRRLRKY